MNKPLIGVLTTFTGSDAAYSLVNVVRVQLEMLHSAGYRPVLFVAPTFAGDGVFSDKRTDIRRIASPADLAEACLDIQVMICHDIVFLSQHKEWADAVRVLAAERDDITWLHWQHSRGGHAPIDTLPRSWFAYPNKGDLDHVARINSTTIDRVRYVPHPLDFNYLGWPDLAIRIAEDFEFPFVDVSGILPARLDRQKQVEKAVRVFAGIKRAGRSVCFLIADAYATGERFLKYKAEVSDLAKELGLTNKEFAFLGEQYQECTYSTPRPVVKALFEMSNLFIQPSNAETSSLVVMEAAMAGNLTVINADFPPIAHLYAKSLALPFGSVFEDTKYYRHIKSADGTETKIEDPQQFFDDEARKSILPVLDQQFTQSVKRQQLRDRWPSRVFAGFMAPLIAEAFAEVKTNSLSNLGDPEVTAIITTLDNLPLLERQIDVLRREVGHIIVVNNGSKDGTGEWLDENAHVPGLSYINRYNMGAGPGRNDGLDLWRNATPYTLMVDGGILPPRGSVKLLKDFLQSHPDISVISPEVETCFTTDEDAASLVVTEPITTSFPQSCLSSTAYALCRAAAWDNIRLSEDGPYGQPGWGVDDQDLQYRWNQAGILHHDFANSSSGWMLYRRKSGSFARLFEETGIWPNQYGSVYEQRNVMCVQDWWMYHRGLCGLTQTPSATYVIEGVPMPAFAMLVKALHEDKHAEVICRETSDPEVVRWLDTFALRWPWGDCTIDPDGKILHRGVDYPEELWSGNVIRNRGPVTGAVTITPDNLGIYVDVNQLVLQAE